MLVVNLDVIMILTSDVRPCWESVLVGDVVVVVVVACGVQFDESFSIVCVLSEMLNDG